MNTYFTGSITSSNGESGSTSATCNSQSPVILAIHFITAVKLYSSGTVTSVFQKFNVSTDLFEAGLFEKFQTQQ